MYGVAHATTQSALARMHTHSGTDGEEKCVPTSGFSGYHTPPPPAQASSSGSYERWWANRLAASQPADVDPQAWLPDDGPRVTGIPLFLMPGRSAVTAVPAPSPQPPPQPLAAGSGWSEHTAPDGRPYYYHAGQGRSSWDKPDELKGARERAVAAALSRSKWRQYTAANGLQYYVDTETKQTSWKMPVELPPTAAGPTPIMDAGPAQVPPLAVPPEQPLFAEPRYPSSEPSPAAPAGSVYPAPQTAHEAAAHAAVARAREEEEAFLAAAYALVDVSSGGAGSPKVCSPDLAATSPLCEAQLLALHEEARGRGGKGRWKRPTTRVPERTHSLRS